MEIRNDLGVLLERIDPIASGHYGDDPGRREMIWAEVMMRRETIPVVARHRPRQLVSAGAMAAAVAALALIFTGVLTGVSTHNATAAQLRSAARADAAAATLPTLTAGQYLFQRSAVTMTCQVGSPTLAAMGATVTYISKGIEESWINSRGSGRVVVRSTPVAQGGSHFATPLERQQWVSAGKPFIPCALGGDANAIIGNPSNTESSGGFQTTVSGYSDFGIVLASTNMHTQMEWGTRITSLPSNVGRLTSMLANGQISPQGLISPTANVCPVGVSAAQTSTGCNTVQQLRLVERLLQLPDSSAKLGSVLYQVIANMPGASVVGSATNAFGVTGVAVQVRTGPGTTFQVVLNQTTGALLQCSGLVANAAPSTSSHPIGEISYGPVLVVNGYSTTPVVLKTSSSNTPVRIAR